MAKDDGRDAQPADGPERVLTEEEWEAFEASTIKFTAKELWESDRAQDHWERRRRGVDRVDPDDTGDLWKDGW